MNSKKSWDVAFTETNFSTVPSGLVTPQNTIQPATQEKTLAMPASPSNDSTHSSHRNPKLGTHDHNQVSLRNSRREARENPNTAASYHPR